MNKWLKVLIIILTGLLASGVTFILNKAYISKHTNFTMVAVAKSKVSPYGPLVNYELAKRVASSIPEDAFTDLQVLEKTTWYAGELGIGEGDIIRKSRLVNTKNNPWEQALGIENNKVLVGVKTDQAQSAGGSIKPGVLVDAFVFISGDGRDIPPKVVSPRQDALLAKLLVKEVQNADLSKPTNKGREAVPVVAIIEASVPVAERLVFYQETGKIYLAPCGIEIKTPYIPRESPVSNASTVSGNKISSQAGPASADVPSPSVSPPAPTVPTTTAPQSGRSRSR